MTRSSCGPRRAGRGSAAAARRPGKFSPRPQRERGRRTISRRSSLSRIYSYASTSGRLRVEVFGARSAGQPRDEQLRDRAGLLADLGYGRRLVELTHAGRAQREQPPMGGAVARAEGTFGSRVKADAEGMSANNPVGQELADQRVAARPRIEPRS